MLESICTTGSGSAAVAVQELQKERSGRRAAQAAPSAVRRALSLAAGLRLSERSPTRHHVDVTWRSFTKLGGLSMIEKSR